jgi:hypothetical protein
MPRKRPKLIALEGHIAVAQKIIDGQQALIERLRRSGQATREAEAALRTYVSSLMHLLNHERKMKDQAKAKRGETRKKQ